MDRFSPRETLLLLVLYPVLLLLEKIACVDRLLYVRPEIQSAFSPRVAWRVCATFCRYEERDNVGDG